MFFSVDCHVTDRMKFVFLQKMGWLKLVELGSLQDKFVTGQSLRKYFLIQIPVILKSMMSSSEFQSVQERLLRILVILAMAQIVVLKRKNNGSHQMIIEIPFWRPLYIELQFTQYESYRILNVKRSPNMSMFMRGCSDQMFLVKRKLS